MHPLMLKHFADQALAKARRRSPDGGTWYHVAAVRPCVFAGTILDRMIRSSWVASDRRAELC